LPTSSDLQLHGAIKPRHCPGLSFKLRVEMQAAQLALKPFRAHWDAIDQLHQDMRRRHQFVE
jgi:hypothetical protein